MGDRRLPERTNLGPLISLLTSPGLDRQTSTVRPVLLLSSPGEQRSAQPGSRLERAQVPSLSAYHHHHRRRSLKQGSSEWPFSLDRPTDVQSTLPGSLRQSVAGPGLAAIKTHLHVLPNQARHDQYPGLNKMPSQAGDPK